MSADAALVTDITGNSLYRVDGAPRRLAGIPGKACGVAAGLDAVWVGTSRGAIVRVPPGRAVASGSGAGIGNLLVHGGALWAADLSGDVIRVRGGAIARVRGIGETEQVAGLGPAVWAIAAGPGQLVRIDARTLGVRRFPIGPSPKAVATGDGAVWVALTDRTLLRFDPSLRRATAVARLPEAPILLAATRGAVWSLPASGRLALTDLRTRRTRVVRAFGARPFGLALGPRTLWVGISRRR